MAAAASNSSMPRSRRIMDYLPLGLLLWTVISPLRRRSRCPLLLQTRGGDLNVRIVPGRLELGGLVEYRRRVPGRRAGQLAERGAGRPQGRLPFAEPADRPACRSCLAYRCGAFLLTATRFTVGDVLHLHQRKQFAYLP